MTEESGPERIYFCSQFQGFCPKVLVSIPSRLVVGQNIVVVAEVPKTMATGNWQESSGPIPSVLPVPRVYWGFYSSTDQAY